MPAKAVYLISPTYRRWLTDHAEIEFELEGFEAKDSPPLQAHLFLRDLDGDAESRSVTPFDGTPRTFLLPRPKFHRRAEIVLIVEDRRTKEPICEGRWNLANIPKEDWPNLTYFDQRGVMFHEGVGRFPIVAQALRYGSFLNVRNARPAEWKAFVDVGFNELVVHSPEVDERSAALAADLKTMLFAEVNSKNDSIEEQRAEIKRVQRFGPVAGYFGCLKDKGTMSWRGFDASRPTIATIPTLDEETKRRILEFQDVVCLNLTAASTTTIGRPSCVREGRAYFGSVIIDSEKAIANLNREVCLAVAQGASGVYVLILPQLAGSILNGPLKELAPLVHAVVRGVPEPSDDSTADRWFWRRRLGPKEKAVIEVKRGDPPTATFTIHKEL